MQNLENLDVFEIFITQKLLKCPKDPFVRSGLIFILASESTRQINVVQVPNNLVAGCYYCIILLFYVLQ